MKTIYLLRHGPLVAKPGLYGVSDIDAKLAQTKAIAINVANHITKDIDVSDLGKLAIISSPLTRCATLARLLEEEITKNTSSLTELDTDSAFQEMNFGQFDGCCFDDIHADSADWQLLARFWQVPLEHPLPQAEPLQVFQQRVINAWKMLVEQVSESTTTLLVSHGGVIRMILSSVLAEDISAPNWYQHHRIDYGCLVKITLSADDVVLTDVSDMFLAGQSKVVFNG
ncbi:histidine phosphatase family protein [Thalassotalea ganghwensis]